MRFRVVLAALVAVFAFALASPRPAEAFPGWYDRDSRSAGLGPSRAVRSWLYFPRHHYRLHSAADPYHYRYEPRGYYPDYNAGYWRPAHTQRGRYSFAVRAPRYYQAQGYGARRCYDRHHRRHRCVHHTRHRGHGHYRDHRQLGHRW